MRDDGDWLHRWLPEDPEWSRRREWSWWGRALGATLGVLSVAVLIATMVVVFREVSALGRWLGF